jgi:hypothetical protein
MSAEIRPTSSIDSIEVASAVAQVASDVEPDFRDADAADNKGAPLHRWVPWIAGFS